MKKLHWLALTFVLMAPASFVSFAAVVDKIVVVVNNEVITQGEMDRILGPMYQQYKDMVSGTELIKKMDEARQAVMGQLIEEKLVLSEARRQGIEIDEKDLDEKIAEAKKKFPTNEMFEQALVAQRISIKELRAKYKEQLMVRRLIDQKVGSKVIVSPNEVVDYYNKHPQEFAKPEEIKLSNILIRPKANVAQEKTMELVGDISRRLNTGGDFAGLARIYSEGPGAKDGGMMGYVKRGDLLPEIESVVFNMKVGEVSSVIRTKLGFHFFRLDDRKAAENLTISDARRSIEDALWMSKMKEKSKEWVEDLRKHAYIAFK